jgi:hypothetical protein
MKTASIRTDLRRFAKSACHSWASLRFVALAILTMALFSAATKADDSPKSPALRDPALRPLPLGTIRPSGWLKNQLCIQANGLSGHLDEIWPDIKDSAWLGGKAEGWERAPYWLDGIVPLAYLLDDDALKAKAQRFIDYVLDHQAPDGWLGPVSDGKHPPYDPWPLYVLFKALTQYQEMTNDPRVIPAIQKALHKIDDVISRKPLESWAHFRASDLILTIDWLYDRTKEPWLLDLAEKVHQQAFDWRKLYADFPYKDRTQRKFNLENHGVNNGMAIKASGVWFRHSGAPEDRAAVFHMLELLDRYHGQPTGTFTCDEHLAGRDPSQGTELCTVVESMFSLETLVAILGEPGLADRLEKLAFNALPATFKPDMCAHQYDQQANQVLCKVAKDRVYVNNNEDSNLFGLEPNFGCCTANMHQGWPKFASHLWMKSKDGGLVAVAYAPCSVETKVGDELVKIKVQTHYPFSDTITIGLHSEGKVRFPLHLRIPAWTKGARVQLGKGITLRGENSLVAANLALIELKDKGGFFMPLDIEIDKTASLTLHFPMKVSLYHGYHDSVAIERGPLVYALQIGTYWKRLRGEPPFADWEVYPTTPWNYALAIDRQHPERSIQFQESPVGDHPFSPEDAPIVAKVKGRLIPWWTLERNAAGPLPESPVESPLPLEELTLVPYGCTSLRVTEFPTLK